MWSFKEVHCCITGKKLSHEDNIINFPRFLDEPDDPKEQIIRYLSDPVYRNIHDCSAKCALRSAFDQWEFKKTVLLRAKESIIQRAHNPPYEEILWQNEKYLLKRVPHEDRVVLYFLDCLFNLDAQRQTWISVCNDATASTNSFPLQSFQNVTNFIQNGDDIIIKKIWSRDINPELQPYESVELPLSKWIALIEKVCNQLSNISSL